jgi:biotin-(acetyl-CoA carboxylase) ligase
VLQSGQRISGRACGVDGDGALLLEVEGVARRIVSGEVSVRPVQ